MKAWVVLPAYNEEEALPPLLDSLIESCADEHLKYTIIVVNDGSQDQTEKVIEDYASRFSNEDAKVVAVHNDGNKGLAETMRRGLMEAVKLAGQNPGSNDLIITMDADNTHPAGLMLRMVRTIREGNDVVIASRYREGSRVIGVSFFRLVLSVGASWLFRLFFPIRGVRDYTCGYRAYRVETIKRLIDRFGKEFISERGFSCMVDILLRLRVEKLVFTEVPLVLRYDLKPGLTKMNVQQTIFDTLKLLIKRRLTGF